MTCPRCQTHNASNVRYCRSCGTALKGRRYRVVTVIVWLAAGLILWMPFSRKLAEGPPPNPPIVHPPIPAPPTTEPPELGGEPVQIIEGTDRYGNPVRYTAWVLVKEFSWVEMSDENIMRLGNIYKKGKDIFSQPLQEEIRKAPEIIGPGLADYRAGTDGLPEESRTALRSKTICWVASQIRKGRESDPTVYSWNLGKWNERKPAAFEDQRRVVIIGVWRSSKSANIREALRDALEKNRSYPLFADLLDCYTKSKDFDIR